jgi:hypothetical protein
MVIPKPLEVAPYQIGDGFGGEGQMFRGVTRQKAGVKSVFETGYILDMMSPSVPCQAMAFFVQGMQNLQLRRLPVMSGRDQEHCRADILRFQTLQYPKGVSEGSGHHVMDRYQDFQIGCGHWEASLTCCKVT